MDRRKAFWLGTLAVIAGAVVWLSVGQRTPPFLPDDETHARYGNLQECLPCHDPEGPAPRGVNHPVGRDCTRCHGIR